MDTNGTGNATENGEQVKQNMPPNEQAAKEQQTPNEPASIPYARFQQVNEARKAAEQVISDMVSQIVASIPEDKRELIPDLPPADKIGWINKAMAAGVFSPPAAPDKPPVDSMDSKRPGGKPPQDLSGLTPVQLMSMGYSR